MSDDMNDDLLARLRGYGRWLDAETGEYTDMKESGAAQVATSNRQTSGRAYRVLAAAAAAVLLVVGSFVVNQVSGSPGSGDVALAWSATPGEGNETQMRAVEVACARARTGKTAVTDAESAKSAIDIRGDLAIQVRALGSMTDICVVSVNQDSPSATLLASDLVPGSGASKDSGYVSEVRVASVRTARGEITVVWGRDTALPSDCRNLDVLTSKGIIRALRASGIFAFWYPGRPSISGLNSSSIQFGCAPDAGPGPVTNVTPSSIAGVDAFSNLCTATIDVLSEHGILDGAMHVQYLDEWDLGVYDVFMHRLAAIAEVMRGTTVFETFLGVNGGNSLALDKSGAQPLTVEERTEVKVATAKAINSFVKLCEKARIKPEDRGVVITATTVQAFEMHPAVQSTLLPG